jgi:hypothetical protein
LGYSPESMEPETQGALWERAWPKSGAPGTKSGQRDGGETMWR